MTQARMIERILGRGTGGPEPASVVRAGLGPLRAVVRAAARMGLDGATALARRISGLARLVEGDAADGPLVVEPVIAYQADAGGWYDVSVGGIVVDRVQGETAAADRAGELLARYAASASSGLDPETTGVVGLGGGWYDLVVRGVPIDRLRGRELANERLEEILAVRR